METLTPARPRSSTRLVGIDAARALAFGGMLLAHFAASRKIDDPGWLQALDNTADGRAAPLFCVLLGVGAGLLAARGSSDRSLVRRGVVLLVLGLAVWPLVETVYLILPHYGLLLALFPLVRRMPTRWLLPAAAVAFVAPSLTVAVAGDVGLRSAGQPASYSDLADVGGLLGQILWSGGYPLVGWAGFVLVGGWVVRHDLRDRGVQWRLVLGGAAVAALQPVAGTGRLFLDGTAHSNHTAWYVVASASAVAVLGACLLLSRWVHPLVPLGQLALTAYLAHLFLGEVAVFPWLRTAEPSLALQVIVATGVFVAFAVAASAWLARHRRGPVEHLVRAVAR